jgi:hypothetical protein
MTVRIAAEAAESLTPYILLWAITGSLEMLKIVNGLPELEAGEKNFKGE